MYSILRIHFRPWTVREMVCFGIILALAAIGTAVLLRRGQICRRQAAAGILMVLCLGIIFASTVFTRLPEPNRLYELNLFWSWKEVFLQGNKELLEENLLNLLLLFPVGFLLPPLCNRKVIWWISLLIGVAVSAGIELSQLAFYRGLFEWDDMIHNGIGCMLGCFVSEAVWKCIGRVRFFQEQ